MPPGRGPEEISDKAWIAVIISLVVGVPSTFVFTVYGLIFCAKRLTRRPSLDQVPMNQRIVALIHDCGLSKETGKILDLLRQNNAKATFFVTGEVTWREDRLEIMRRIESEGHEFGIHPPRNKSTKWYISRIAMDLRGPPPKYLRHTATVLSDQNDEAIELSQKMDYVLLQGEIRPVADPATVQVGTIIPIIAGEERKTDAMLKSLRERGIGADTLSSLLGDWKEQMDQTPGWAIERGFSRENGTCRLSIADWPPQPDVLPQPNRARTRTSTRNVEVQLEY